MRTDYDMTAETVSITGNDGDEIEAYVARVDDDTARGGVVVIHHLPGYDRESREHVRRFAAMGYNSICPNLYTREAPGGDPSDAAATARANGGVPDDRLVGDIAGGTTYLKNLSNSNGKVGAIGHCSGGRQAFLVDLAGIVDAAVDCYGAFVVGTPPDGFPLKVTPLIDRTPELTAPLLGLFGNDDKFPSPEQVDELEAALKAAGKPYEFFRYDGAGHAFFSVDRPAYRPEAAVEGWGHIERFFNTYLGS